MIPSNNLYIDRYFIDRSIAIRKQRLFTDHDNELRLPTIDTGCLAPYSGRPVNEVCVIEDDKPVFLVSVPTEDGAVKFLAACAYLQACDHENFAAMLSELIGPGL